MPTAPTLVAYAQVETGTTSGTNITTASISWQTGDVIIVHTGTEGSTGGETQNTPTTTGSGISLVLQQKHDSTGSDAGVGCWACVATANSSGTFSFNATHAASTRTKGLSVEVWRGSAGIGNSAILPTGGTPNTSRTVSLTPTGADSAASWHLVDWNADPVQSFAPTPTTHNASSPGPTAEPVSGQLSLVVTYYFAVLDDQASSGATGYGIGGTGTGPFSVIAIEIKGSSGGGAGATAGPLAFPPFSPMFRDPSTMPLQLMGDTSPPSATPIALSDTGTGADDVTVSASVPLADTSTGTDALTVAATVTLADTGTGTDDVTVTQGPLLTDTGTGTDAINANATVTLSDTATGIDNLTVLGSTDPNQAWPQFATMFLEPSAASLQMLGDTSGSNAVTLSDTATGTDAFTVSASVPLADTSTGTDALTVTAAVPLTDTGTGTDSLTANATVNLSDTGTGTDAISVATGSNPQLSDTATGTDALTVTVSTTLADTATGTDTFVGTRLLTLADTSAITDLLTVASATPLADVGTGTDGISVTAGAPLGDTGTGTDGFVGGQLKTLTDSATGADAISVIVGVIQPHLGTASISGGAGVATMSGGAGTAEISQ